MVNGYRDKNKKFHPFTTYKPVRKKRNKTLQPDGVRLARKVPKTPKTDKFISDTEKLHRQAIPLDENEIVDWEKTVKSRVQGFNRTKIDGMDVLELTFENGEKWFEFKSDTDENNFVRDQIQDAVKSTSGQYHRDPRIEDHLEVDQNSDVRKWVLGELGVNKGNIDAELDKFTALPRKWLRNRGLPARIAIEDGVVDVNIKDFTEHIEDDAQKPKDSSGGLVKLDHRNVEGYKITEDDKRIFEKRVRGDE